MGKFAAFSERPKATNVSASGGLCTLSPGPGALPLDPVKGFAPDLHYRGFTFGGASNSLAPALNCLNAVVAAVVDGDDNSKITGAKSAELEQLMFIEGGAYIQSKTL